MCPWRCLCVCCRTYYPQRKYFSTQESSGILFWSFSEFHKVFTFTNIRPAHYQETIFISLSTYDQKFQKLEVEFCCSKMTWSRFQKAVYHMASMLHSYIANYFKFQKIWYCCHWNIYKLHCGCRFLFGIKSFCKYTIRSIVQNTSSPHHWHPRYSKALHRHACSKHKFMQFSNGPATTFVWVPPSWNLM